MRPPITYDTHPFPGKKSHRTYTNSTFASRLTEEPPTLVVEASCLSCHPERYKTHARRRENRLGLSTPRRAIHSVNLLGQVQEGVGALTLLIEGEQPRGLLPYAPSESGEAIKRYADDGRREGLWGGYVLLVCLVERARV